MQTKRWTAITRNEAQSVTVDLGDPVVTDRVVLVPVREPRAEDIEPAERISVLARGTGEHGALGPLAGVWKVAEDKLEYRFPMQVLSAVQVSFAPGPAMSLERIHVPAAGMGTSLRYRTGPNAELSNAPWITVEDRAEPLWVEANRYIQVECELWSAYANVGPVLRYVQVERHRFEANPSNSGLEDVT